MRTSGKKATRECPCGYLGHASGKCKCTPDQIARYRGRVSGPLLDRIDLQIEVPSLPAEALPSGRGNDGEPSAVVRARVIAAASRQCGRQGKPNSQLQPKEVERWCAPDAPGEALLKNAFARLSLSARAYHRILKVARTIADLAAAETLSAAHVAEAIGYRRFDRIGLVVHVLTTATIYRLRELYPQGRFEARRVRPNIVVEPVKSMT